MTPWTPSHEVFRGIHPLASKRVYLLAMRVQNEEHAHSLCKSLRLFLSVPRTKYKTAFRLRPFTISAWPTTLLLGFGNLMSFRTLHSVDQNAGSGVVIADVMPAVVAPVSLIKRNLVPTRNTLNFVAHILISLCVLFTGTRILNNLGEPSLATRAALCTPPLCGSVESNLASAKRQARSTS